MKKLEQKNNNFSSVYCDDIEWLKISRKSFEKFISLNNIDGMKGTYARIGNALFHLILSGYSSEQSMQILKTYGEELFDSYLKSWNADCYFDIGKSYEIAIIFDMPKEKVMKFYELQKNLNYKDKYLDFLVKYFDNEHEITTEKLKANRAISPLVEVIELAATDKEKAVSRLKTYLDKQWLNMQKEGLITNKQHLNPTKFRGYLSIESAALVKMLGLNDEMLKSSLYYPVRLAHYKE